MGKIMSSTGGMTEAGANGVCAWVGWRIGLRGAIDGRASQREHFRPSTRYGSLRAPTRTLTDALSAALDAPTGVSQAAAFATVVGLRLAALRWGLQTPVPADVARKLQSRHREDDQDTPQAPDA
jgi:hypothetical protein